MMMMIIYSDNMYDNGDNDDHDMMNMLTPSSDFFYIRWFLHF